MGNPAVSRSQIRPARQHQAGRSEPTRAGYLIVLLAALTTLGVGVSFLSWGESLPRFDPFLAHAVAAGAGILVLGIGWVILRALGIPFSRKGDQ